LYEKADTRHNVQQVAHGRNRRSSSSPRRERGVTGASSRSHRPRAAAHHGATSDCSPRDSRCGSGLPGRLGYYSATIERGVTTAHPSGSAVGGHHRAKLWWTTPSVLVNGDSATESTVGAKRRAAARSKPDDITAVGTKYRRAGMTTANKATTARFPV